MLRIDVSCSALLSFYPLLLPRIVVLGLLQKFRLRIPILGLHFVEVWVLARLRLLLGRVLHVTVSLVGRIHYLPVCSTVSTWRRGATLALAAERTLLVRRVTRTAIHRARLVLVHLFLTIVVALLSLEALEVGVLASSDLVLLEVGEYSFFRHFLRVAVDVSLALLLFWRLIHAILRVLLAARDHVIVVVLRDLLVAAHDLVELHLAVGELTRVHFLVLCVVLYLWDLVHVHFWALLAVHVIVLSLPMGPTNHVRIIILMILKLLELRLGLVIR